MKQERQLSKAKYEEALPDRRFLDKYEYCHKHKIKQILKVQKRSKQTWKDQSDGDMSLEKSYDLMHAKQI